MNAILGIENVTAGYGGKEILRTISLNAAVGEMISLLGPNGCGKTTLLRSICGLIPLMSGGIFVGGAGIKRLGRNDIARKISFVPQLSGPVQGFSVEEMVFMGREPYLGLLSSGTKKDHDMVYSALERTGLLDLKDRDTSELSGGEYQRVLIARALAQGTEIILLDEPTAHLDLRHQMDVLTLLNNMNDKLVIAVMHDLHLTKKYFGRAILLKDGRVHDDGIPPDILNAVNIKEVFGVEE